jgi:SAM-dependent methyltransferase
MNKLEKQDVLRRYAERINRLGPTVQALGWRNKEQQNLRFEIFQQLISLENNISVLDVGCGFGDLYNFLSEKINVDYTGCDLSPVVIEYANKNRVGGKFTVRDILEDPYQENSFDYVFMSGLFNYKIDNNLSYLKSMINEGFRISNKSLMFNLTSTLVDYQDQQLYYYKPEEVLNFCSTLSRRFILRHDYPLYEFTVCLIK